MAKRRKAWYRRKRTRRAFRSYGKRASGLYMLSMPKIMGVMKITAWGVFGAFIHAYAKKLIEVPMWRNALHVGLAFFGFATPLALTTYEVVQGVDD